MRLRCTFCDSTYEVDSYRFPQLPRCPKCQERSDTPDWSRGRLRPVTNSIDKEKV